MRCQKTHTVDTSTASPPHRTHTTTRRFLSNAPFTARRRRPHTLCTVKLTDDELLANTVSEEPPKFLPFTAANELQRRMVQFHCELPVADDADKTLVVRAVTQQWVPATADLLAASFAEALGFGLYKNYLKRQIRKYVQHHMVLPPKAVVLIALLVDKKLAQEAAAAAQATTATNNNYNDDNNNNQTLPTKETTSPHTDEEEEEEVDPHASFGDAMAEAWPTPNSSSNSSDSDDDNSGGININSMSSSFISPSGGGITEGIDTVGSDDEWDMGINTSTTTLVGVVELSFAESTRSKYLTLNPPTDRAYLCNMAIDPQHRNKGYGSQLLTAAEELVTSVGETMVYLHLRFQDQPAKGLYKKAGYKVVNEDTVLVKLLGLDRRFLMRKILKQ